MLVTLALATSLDSLGVGLAYGLNNTQVRISAHVCISLVMFLITWAAVTAGNHIARILPDSAGKILSAVLFVALGVWMLAPLFSNKERPATNAPSEMPGQ